MYKILFVEAAPEAIIKRYKETRRSHPLSGNGRVDEGSSWNGADWLFCVNFRIIPGYSQLLTRELKEELEKIFVENQKFKNLMITVLSFGFKYGIPGDSDLVFDVRFLPNPYYIEGMRFLSGNDKPVSDYVMGFDLAQEFSDKLEDMLRFLIPNYISEGNPSLWFPSDVPAANTAV